ncbi:MAG: TIGR02117 family protein [Gammaproteobacteria bacterium]|nr:TIGR02117 family protein [Gammaproteobacteria bacterium]MDH5650617.1 TIGR02117 family protein [Gammaproteobacteria bacterium]
MRLIGCMLICLSAAGCSVRPYVVDKTDIVVPGPQQVYVVSHGWHTGFVVQSKIIQARIPQLGERFRDVPFLEFGWGDKGFYQAQTITSGLTVQAIFWPTASVVHVVAVPKAPAVYFPDSEIRVVCLSAEQYALLMAYIESSFLRDAQGRIMPARQGLYGNSQFYEGVGDYHLFNTCNKWTAKGLRSAGLDIDTTFKLTAGSIMSFLEEADNKAFLAGCSGDVMTVRQQ